MMPPAYSAPRPRAEEWWFGTWDIQSKVWPISTGKGVTVAVIDSGVNANLPDLHGVVESGTDVETGKGDGRADIDTLENGHGTAMAALIAGQGSGVGMVGVAPGARILPIRAQGGRAELADGIRYAVDHGAEVINVSQGLPDFIGCDNKTKSAVSYALEHDAVIVASAGNDGNGRNVPEWPGECPGVLAVGAVDHLFSPWVKTQRQPYVAVAAPGVRAGSIDRTGKFVPDWDGTSQASALTSSVVALVRSKFPNMRARQVVQRIVATARDVGPRGRDDLTGYGLVRPYHALVDKVASDAPNPVFSAWESARAAASTHASAVSKPQIEQSPGPAYATKRRGTLAILMAVGIVAGVAAVAVCALIRVRNRRRVSR
ncbi:type VII secretion-associated serine protease mycosin [Actinoallomurus liliacearum]|uniref:Type VII secretion-associated serine protease mycosin n=2 Tax=Actinoallomurus liliacearum TaxID=1080073 RepID=A0ABP8TU06_9ACTN